MTEDDKIVPEDSLRKEKLEQRILSFLGMATKARRTVSGHQAVVDAIGRGYVQLVLIAQDASSSTVKKIELLCQEADIRYCRFSDRQSLGKYLGKADRAIAAVTDKGFADRLIQLLGDGYEVC